MWNFLLCCCYISTKFSNITPKVEQIQRIQVFSVHAVGVSREWFLWMCTVLLTGYFHPPTGVFGQRQRQQPKLSRFCMFTWQPHNRNPIVATIKFCFVCLTQTNRSQAERPDSEGKKDQETSSHLLLSAKVQIFLKFSRFVFFFTFHTHPDLGINIGVKHKYCKCTIHTINNLVFLIVIESQYQ